MDRVEKIDGRLGLVGLQGADHVQVDLAEPFPQRGPFPGGFLNIVFAEHPLALFQNRLDPRQRLHLRDGDERHGAVRAPGVPFGLAFPGENIVKRHGPLLLLPVRHRRRQAKKKRAGESPLFP